MKSAAKRGDHVVAFDTHLCSGAPTPVPFDGLLDAKLSPNVLAEHRHVAVVGSKATNTPPHVPPPGTTFDIPPHNTATVTAGSAKVFVNNQPIACDGDTAKTCNDPIDAQVGLVIAKSTVKVGG